MQLALPPNYVDIWTLPVNVFQFIFCFLNKNQSQRKSLSITKYLGKADPATVPDLGKWLLSSITTVVIKKNQIYRS